MTTRYKSKEEFEIALRKAPPANWLTESYNKSSKKEDMPTLAHELAHLLKGTVDNTLAHSKTEARIMQELAEL